MSMVNKDIDATLHKVLQRTLEQTLKLSAPDKAWQIRQTEKLEDIDHDHCIVLTISSFRFRIMCLLHLSLDDNTKMFVAAVTSTKPDDLDDSAYLDYLLELSNSLCGNLKRNLQSSCPPLGMSTPNLLDRACLTFDQVIDITHGVHASAVAAPNSPSLFAASALVSLKDDHDFNLQHYQDSPGDSGADVDNSGELELF